MDSFQQGKYATWRDKKLANYNTNPESLFVEIKAPFRLSNAEKKAISKNCISNNLSFIKIKPQANTRGAIKSINTQLDLVDFDQHLCVEDDGLVLIENNKNSKKELYITYSNKALNWHTDSYYNQIEDLVNAFSLYCIEPAIKGGENNWIDPEMLYIKLRESNIDIIKALSHPCALTIPTRQDGNKIVRQTSVGPIFFIDKTTKKPKMRFTQRKKNVVWLKSSEFEEALCELNNFLARGSEIHHKYKLTPGDGLICNNVLHNRSAFVDTANHQRKLLRGRYKNNIGHY